MNQVWKVSSILAVLAALVVMGLSTQGDVRAQTRITVDKSYICSGGPGCTLFDNDNDSTNDWDFTSNPGNVGDEIDNVLVIDLPSGGTQPTWVTLKVGGKTKAFGDADGSGSIEVAKGEVEFVNLPISIVVIDAEVPETVAGTPDTFAIQAFSGNTIEIDFGASDKAAFQAVKEVTVDNFVPSIIVHSPEDPYITKTKGGTAVTFSATITDSLAGFADTAATSGATKRLQYDDQQKVASAPNAAAVAEEVGGRIDLKFGDLSASPAAQDYARAPLRASHFEKVSDGWRVTWTVGASGLKSFITADEGKIPWHIEAVDRAGNLAKSDGSVKDTTTANTSVSLVQAESLNFAGGGYRNALFEGRDLKITPRGNVAVTDTTGGEYTPPDTITSAGDCNNPDVTTLSGSSNDFTADDGAQWKVGKGAPSETLTRPIAGFTTAASGSSTFTWTPALNLTLSLSGTVDDDGDANTLAKTCNFQKAATDLPAGSTIEVLNTRTITLDDVDPKLVARTTGTAWNAGADKGKRLLTGPAGKAKSNSIMVAIDDTSGLDSSTITPSAFAVVGHTVESVVVIDSSKEHDNDNPRIQNEKDRLLVFLTLADDLETSAKPEVSIPVGVILDNAGNALNDEATPQKAADGLGPNLTLSTDEPISKKEVTISVASDEDLGAPPTLYTTEVIKDENDQLMADKTGSSPRPTRASGSLQLFTAKHTATAENSGRYSVYAEGSDTVGVSNKGTEGHAKDPLHASAFTYQLDTLLNKGQQPKVTIGKVVAGDSLKGGEGHVEKAKAKDVEIVDPMIVTVDFALEGSEYPGDTYRTVMLTDASLKITADDGSTLEQKSFNLTTDVTTPDNIKFTFSLLNPRVGNYELTVKAEDSAGNIALKNASASLAEPMKFTWTAVAPKPVDISLEPGWNLISLPFQPGNPAINSVIPADHPVDIVMTFDNASQVWMVSRRDAESGLFVGDIAVLTANTAYFVRTKNFQAINILRPAVATAAAAPPPPPAISVVEGWNLVPVVTNEIPAPKGVAADGYFGTLGSGSNAGWLKALTFDTRTRTWTSVAPGETISRAVNDDSSTNPCTGKKIEEGESKLAQGEVPCLLYSVERTKGQSVTLHKAVIVGKGYWLYATKDGVIIP